MFERFFGLRENPFPAGHQLRFLYPSREHQEARAHLRYGIENREPFVLITGEVGTGKTTALYDALAEWGNQVQVSLITNSALTRQELIEEIGLRFGLELPPGLSKPQTLVQLERFLHTVRTRGDYAVLVLDEAHNLATDLLEEIRLLSNLESQGENLLQIFLVGQPELEAKLARPELRQLRQRISVHYRLNPLSPEETAGYIHHRISVTGGNAWVIFPPDACRDVYRITHGIPREINTVASAAMLTAYTENSQTVRPQHVRAIQSETQFSSVLKDQPLANDEALAGGDAAMVTPTPVPPPAAPPPPPPSVPAVAAPAPPAATPEPPPLLAPPVPVVPAAEAGEWQPRSLEPAAQVPPVAPARPQESPAQEADAWAAAARELIEAKRRASAPPPPPAPPPAAYEPPAPRSVPPRITEPPPARRSPEEPTTLPFPTPAELARRRGADPHAQPDSGSFPPEVRAQLEEMYGKPNSRRPLPAEDLEWPPRRRTPWMLIGGVAGVVLAVAIVLWKLLSGGVLGGAKAPQRPAPAPRDSVATVQPPATSVQPGDAGATPAVATPAPTTTPAAEPQKPAVNPPAAKPATTTATAAARPDSAQVRVHYGIAVGEYLNEQRAYVERDRLGAATGLPTRVLPYREQGVTMYRLVLGSFDSRDAAENSASDLFTKGLVPQASVMPLTR